MVTCIPLILGHHVSVCVRCGVYSLSLVSDYVRVRVGYAILPSLAVVHLGATVCFTTHLTEGMTVCVS